MLLEGYIFKEKDIKKTDDLKYIKIRHPYYKYMVVEDFKIDLGLKKIIFETNYYKIIQGILYIKKGYIWDGASGPTIDTKSTIIASLVHDALYQSIREGCNIKKEIVDDIFYNLMIQKSNSLLGKIRAKTFLLALKLFGYSSTRGGIVQWKYQKKV